jgi:predicted HNH restriction endonuclease
MRESVKEARKAFDKVSKYHRAPCCARCGMTAAEHLEYGYGQLQVHHKQPIRELGSAANDPKNYDTLCKFCHDEWHKFAEKLSMSYGEWFKLEPFLNQLKAKRLSE